jgi:hypothetical protein
MKGVLEPFACETESGKYIVVQSKDIERAKKKIVEEYGEIVETIRKVE